MVEEVKNNSQRKPGPFLHVTMPDGTTKDYSVGEASAKGLTFSNTNQNTKTYTYKGEDGRDLFTQDIADLPASITLNQETGNIQITAPKEVTDSDMFKRIFDEETLNQYSLAYKLNPEYKISITEKNEETGEDEDKEVTIPEYVERLNSSIANYMSNLRNLHKVRDNLTKKYGDKANNLSDEKMAIVTQDPSGAIYLPDSLFNVNSFGNKKNPFLELKNKRNADGLVSLEDFAKVYTRDNFGRDEMAGLLAHLEGYLQGSDWSTKDTYSDSDGVEHKNMTSATEAAKILAFKNYVTTKNPDAEWNQQAGDYIESLFTNAAHQVTRIFGNMASLGEMVVTRGEGTSIQQGVQEMDDAMEYFNENNTLVWDAVTNAQIWGTIGGIALGSWGVGRLMSFPVAGVKAISGALTAKRVAMLAEKGAEMSLGAKLAFGALTAAERTAAAINVAMTGISGIAKKNIFTEYVFDTMHDAILYDAAGFRSMLTSLAEEAEFNDKAGAALEYWLQQYTDNAKWWGPMGLARTIVKGAGKTALGKAANMIITKYENKFQAFVGKKVQSVQDNMAGGSVVRKLEEKLDDLGENEKTKRLRLERQIEIEKNNVLLREARERLGNIKLDWDGVKLTEDSWNEWRKAMTEIKAREVAIDLYRNGVEAETRIMHQAFKDPATGKPMFLYEELAGANMKATKWYFGLVDLSNKHGLKVAEDSLLNQDVTDYWIGSYKHNVMDFVANSNSTNAADAQKAAEIGAENIAKIRARLPEDITNYIDEGIKSQIFQQYYKQLNEYGVANKILNKGEIDSYNANEIWIKNGYMPIIVKNDVTGRWISDDDKIESIVEQEMQHYRYSTRVDEHYADPELVRQTRIRHFAQARTNVDIWKSYSGFGSNATNVTVVSGEETAYAKRTQNSVQALQDAVDNYTRSVFAEAKIEDVIKIKPRKTKGNNVIEEETMDTIVANMSPSEVTDFLRQKRILTADKPTLSGEVTEENYAEWFKNQSVQVKKYLLGKYAAYGDTIEENAREAVRKWSQEEWYAYEDLLQTVGRMASTADALGTGSKPYWDIYEQVRDMAIRAPYKDAMSVGAIKNHILKELDHYNLPKSMIEKIDVNSARFTGATNARMAALKSPEDIAYRMQELEDRITKTQYARNRYEALSDTLQRKLNVGAGPTTSTSSASYYSAYLRTKRAIEDGTVAPEDELVEFARQLAGKLEEDGLHGQDYMTAKEFVALDDLLNGGDIKNVDFDSIRMSHLKKWISEYSDLSERADEMGINIDNFRPATNADYPGWDVDGKSGQASENFSMLDESDPNFSREGTRRDYYRDWKGRELAVLEMTPSDYTRIMADNGHLLNPTDEVEKKVASYTKRFEEGERAPITYITFGENGKFNGQEGRHRALAAERAGIEKMPVLIDYKAGTHPKILDEYKDVTERFVKRADDSVDINARVIKTPYKLTDIQSGKVNDATRAKLAYRVADDYFEKTGKRGVVFYRWQDRGDIGKISGKTAAEENSYFKDREGAEKLIGDGAYEVRSDGRYFYNRGVKKDEELQRIFFPVKSSDVLTGNEYFDIKNIAKALINRPIEKRTFDLARSWGGKIFTEGAAPQATTPDEVLEKILKLDDAGLKRLVDNDLRAYAELTDKKVIVPMIGTKRSFQTHAGAYIFPDRDPELVQDGLKEMSKITGELETESTMSEATRRNINKRKLQKLIDSQENVDFLNKIGWNRGVDAISRKGAYGDYGGSRVTGFERIRLSARNIDNIKQLQTTELHEITHAAWARASIDTKKAIGQDLVNKLGLKIKVDDMTACSRDMNELIAHSIDSRFSFGKGWTEVAKDNQIQKHLTNLAKNAGVNPTKAFKERALTLVWGFINFVKTKLLGINNAKTFDEFYQGLLSGDFAKDLQKKLSEFKDVGWSNLNIRPQMYLEDLDVPDNLRKIQVSGEEEASNVPVRFMQSENTVPANAGQEGIAQPNSIVPEGLPDPEWLANGGQNPNRIKIPIRDRSTGRTSIFVDAGSPNSYDLFKKALQDGGNDFEEGLERAYVVGSEKLAKASLVNEAARNLEAGKDAFYEGTMLARIRGELRGILNVDTDAFVDDVYQEVKELTGAYVKEMLNSPATQDALKLLADDANASDDVYKFLVLQELSKKENMEKAVEALNGKLKKLFDKKKFKSLKHGDVDLMKKKAGELLVGVIDNEKNMARLAANTVSPGLLETKDLFDRVKDINKRIKEADERLGQDYVMYLDDEGRSVYAQVDPTFASLFNYRYKLEKGEATALAKVNAAMSRAFRYGTTSVNLSSFGNQMFRDFGNAILVGGSWQTIKANYQNLVDVFGERIVDQIRRFDPTGYEMKQVAEYAQKTGKTVEEAAVSRELARGQAMAPSTTERSLYKNFMREAYSNKSDKLLTRAESDIKKILNKLNPEDLLNGKRENYLRNRVFASSLNDAIKEGYTLEQARVYAHFAMNNVTTNFSRGVYHLQAIADSTPYFRAAINGTKSFWRVWSLDPVGITGRIMGGLVIPTMYLTGMSLGSEENKEVYMNIPEYQKENSMVFVMNGQPFSIPIPQELGAVVAPFRQFVEYLHSANKNDFWELMMNNLLGLSPVDIQGFSAIDMDRMIQDPTIFDRISRGMSRVFAQMAPVPVKSAYMLATGTDPYTGKSLRDKSYMYWNEETESLEVMDYNQNAFAQWFADLFGDWMSPELAEKIVSGIIGTTGSNLLGDFAKLVQEQSGLAMLKNMGANIVEQSSKPFTIQKYDLTTSIWKRAIQELTTEKDAILDSKEMKKISSELAQTKDPEKRQKLLAQQQDIVDNFQQKVKDVVTRLSTEYDGSLDRKKLAAVLTLLNFNSDSAFQTGTQYSSNVASELFWDGRDAAVHTLERMGVTGTSDMSIFGYLATDKKTGKPIVKYNSPIAMLDMDAQWDNQDDAHAANIKAILSQNDIYDAHKAVSDQIQKIYGSKSKLTNADRANIEAIQINWNAQLAKTIAPYVAKMTPEAAINNTQVLNALYPYVEVPGSWETNDKGRFVSLGSRGNKKKAYYDSWIKSMFSINDQYKGQY